MKLMPDHALRVVRFGHFEVDLRAGELRRNGVKVKLQNQPFQILAMLLEHPGEIITRDEMRARLWPVETFVDFDHGLNSAIRRLRDALGDSAESPTFVETLGGRGYRFVSPIERLTNGNGNPGLAIVVPLSAPEPNPAANPGPSVQRNWRGKAAIISVGCLIAVATLCYPWASQRIAQLLRLYEMQRLTVVPLTTLAGNVVSPTFSPDGSQVAFGWDGETDGEGYDLYVKTIGTDNVLRLTHHPAKWLSAAWSPDGRSIAISRIAGTTDSGIYQISPTGGSERMLTYRINHSQYAKDISWSPDGKYLAFTDHPPDTSWERALQLFLLSLDTLDRTLIRTNCDLVMTPAFSPKGGLLAWTCVDSWSSFSLHVMRLTDRSSTQLVNRLDGIGGLAWSKDGRRIVFTSPLDFGNLREILVARPKNAEQLPVGHDASDISVSREGDRLAYVQGVVNTNIWRIDLHGPTPEMRSLVASSREEKAPSISPDGTKIAFESNRSGVNELWVSDADGSNAKQLTSFGLRATGTPRWSPDGKFIAFDSRVGGEANIYLIDPSGGIPRKLNIDIRSNNLPSWSNNGRWIYFVNGEDAHKPSVWKVAVEGGHAVRLVQYEATYPLESPDGQSLYFVRNRYLWQASTDGSAPHQVDGMPRLMPLGEKWALSGKGIYFLADQMGKSELDFFDLGSRSTNRVLMLEKSPPAWMGELAVSGDGNWLLYTRLDEQSSNLMMIENWR
jgi:Tol biopolymer transport system component/DNA-binding winged helix-turn-helix (wHTH) protein